MRGKVAAECHERGKSTSPGKVELQTNPKHRITSLMGKKTSPKIIKIDDLAKKHDAKSKGGFGGTVGPLKEERRRQGENDAGKQRNPTGKWSTPRNARNFKSDVKVERRRGRQQTGAGG